MLYFFFTFFLKLHTSEIRGVPVLCLGASRQRVVPISFAVTHYPINVATELFILQSREI